MQKLIKSNEEWKKILNPLQYKILREGGTEKAFTGELLNNKEEGIYSCAACGNELFSSETKYDSGTGWPSFCDANYKNIELRDDLSMGMIRTEVLCKNCGSHLGHLFLDGPMPGGKRFCINSNALDFKKK